MSSTPPRSQIRLYAITGSMADISTVANQRAAAPAASIAAENLHDILGHMAGAITRIHGSSSFTEAAAGVFTHDEAVFTGDIKVKGGDLKTDAIVASVFDTVADTVLVGGEAELIQIGASGGLVELAGDARVSGSIEMVGSGMELIDRVGGSLKIRGGDLTGSVGKVYVELSGSELHMQDGYSSAAGWSGAISLADSSTDWSRFKSVFGEASILSAISTAAALPADARFLYKVTNAESGVTSLGGDKLRQVDGTHFSSSFAAVPAASRNENVDVFLNGQLLVSKSYNSGDYDYDIASDGTLISFNFGLQPDDFVSILVPVTVASVASYIGSNGSGGAGGGAGGSGATDLDGLADVSISSPTTNQVLKYDGSQWVNSVSPAGATDLDGLTDVAITSPISGHVLQYNGSQWINTVVTGTQGPQGATGATGPQGATGATGAQGSAAAAFETVAVSATALSGSINLDLSSSQIFYYTSNATANWTPNVRNSSSGSLDSLMSTGDSRTVTVMATLGSSGYYAGSLQIDGTSVTPKWAGGLSPSFGNEYGIDVYSYTIVKTASATFTVFASVSQFA